ncbi:MAG: hypothetical protein OXQ93_12390 [Gemmatimonadota bacterium]|nr:hypothetical protein [Gemmatimonadota bacterium]
MTLGEREMPANIRHQLTRIVDNLDHNGLLLLMAEINRHPEDVADTMFSILVERLPMGDAMPPQILETVVEILRRLSYHDLSFLAVSLGSSHRREVMGLIFDELHRRTEKTR